MIVLRARAMGMCFGVRDALHATRQVHDPANTTIYGELVHNPAVTQELANRGFASLPENRRALPSTPQVLITAHGLSNRDRDHLEQHGKSLLDTTCPLVRRAHRAALLLHQQGYFVVVIGKPDHVEVLGLIGDLQNYAVVSTLDDVKSYPEPRLGIICQTTTPPPQAKALIDGIRRLNPHSEIRHVDTICRPTRERQQALLDLVTQVDALVVVGGRHSNNTRQLVDLARQHNTPVSHVESANEVDPTWARQFTTVGITAGTSTLDSTVDEVEEALLQA